MQRIYFDFWKSHEEFEIYLYFCKKRVKILPEAWIWAVLLLHSKTESDENPCQRIFAHSEPLLPNSGWF